MKLLSHFYILNLTLYSGTT